MNPFMTLQHMIWPKGDIEPPIVDDPRVKGLAVDDVLAALTKAGCFPLIEPKPTGYKIMLLSWHQDGSKNGSAAPVMARGFGTTPAAALASAALNAGILERPNG